MVEQKAQISSVNWLEQKAHVLDRAKSSSANDTKPIHLPLEVPGDLDAHPHPPLISQVHLVMVRLRLAPLHGLVFLHTSDAAILLFLCAILDPQPVKPGGGLPLLLVEVDDPGIQLLHLVQEVVVVGGPLSGNQTSLGAFSTVATTSSFLTVLWYWFWWSIAILKWRMLPTMSVLVLPLIRSFSPPLKRILIGLTDFP